MWRDRDDPLNLLALVPALRLAMAPVLAALDQLLEDDTRFQRVTADLWRRPPHRDPRAALDAGGGDPAPGGRPAVVPLERGGERARCGR